MLDLTFDNHDFSLVLTFTSCVCFSSNIYMDYTAQYFLLDVNFEKFTVKLHYFYIVSILKEFQSNQKLTVMSLINFLNSSLCNLK